MPIYFDGFPFSTPVPLVRWTPPRRAGIYTVMVEDPQWKPVPARPIYFGESGDLAGRGFPFNHHAVDVWFEVARGALLWISYLPTPGWSDSERRSVETRLTDHYQTPCNARIGKRQQAALIAALESVKFRNGTRRSGG